jgi:hypothetical protein
MEAKNVVLDIEEAYRRETLLGQVQEFRRSLDLELIPDEAEISLADQMRLWEQDGPNLS